MSPVGFEMSALCTAIDQPPRALAACTSVQRTSRVLVYRQGPTSCEKQTFVNMFSNLAKIAKFSKCSQVFQGVMSSRICWDLSGPVRIRSDASGCVWINLGSFETLWQNCSKFQTVRNVCKTFVENGMISTLLTAPCPCVVVGGNSHKSKGFEMRTN